MGWVHKDVRDCTRGTTTEAGERVQNMPCRFRRVCTEWLWKGTWWERPVTFPASYPIDILGKLAGKMANGNHLKVVHLASSCNSEAWL